jgi:type 1 fimbriae regulatory protein FimB
MKATKERKYLTEAELTRFMSRVSTEPKPYNRARNSAIFTLMYWRGLRASEVGKFRLSDWRQETGRLYVERLKGSLTSEPLLSPAENRALKAWIRVRGHAPGPLFPSREGGKGIQRGMLHVLFARYAKAAGLPGPSPGNRGLRHCHCLKHSIGTHLMGKLSVEKVQAWLGHRDIRSTMVYAQFRSLELDKAAAEVYEQLG